MSFIPILHLHNQFQKHPTSSIDPRCSWRVLENKTRQMERMIPARFGRLAIAFDDVSMFKPCESSGSEHSQDKSFTDLSDLVNSFLEQDGAENTTEDQDQPPNRLGSDKLWLDSETRDELRSLMGNIDSNDSRKIIKNEVEMAMGFDGVNVDKRKLMTRLRERGLDAGICKSKLEKTGRIPAGDFEYMDINMSDTRYIVELNLASQFEIARQTKGYTALLDMFPKIYVGKVDELKRIVRIMCAAIRVSLKSADMPVAPWRRNGYMQAKWLGSYKRTTNAVSGKLREQSAAVKPESKSRSVAGCVFDSLIPRKIEFGCGNEGRAERKSRVKFGHLAAPFAT